MSVPNPADAAKAPVHGVKGVAAFAKKKPAVTIAVVGGIGVAAYMIRKRNNAQNADAAMSELDYSGANAPIGSITNTDPYGGGGSGFYPDPTQGVGEGGFAGGMGSTPLPPDSWGPPWWWTNPFAQGGGLPTTIPGSINTPEIGQDVGQFFGPAEAPAIQQPAPLVAIGSPHVVSSKPQPTNSGSTASRPSWAGPGNKYPYQSDRGWYRLVMVDNGPHKGRWHYYGPSDNPRSRCPTTRTGETMPPTVPQRHTVFTTPFATAKQGPTTWGGGHYPPPGGGRKIDDGTAYEILGPIFGKNWKKAAAIGKAESGGDTHARNVNRDGSVDRGWFQINSKYHPEVPDAIAYGTPRQQALAAFAISKGGTDWHQWATNSIANPDSMHLPNADDAGLFGVGRGEGADTAVSDAASGVDGFLGKFSVIFKSGFWLRVGLIIAGLALLGFGVAMIGKQYTVPAVIGKMIGGKK
jgi:hypothetical protein